MNNQKSLLELLKQHQLGMQSFAHSNEEKEFISVNKQSCKLKKKNKLKLGLIKG